jgi:hypothetical protein
MFFRQLHTCLGTTENCFIETTKVFCSSLDVLASSNMSTVCFGQPRRVEIRNALRTVTANDTVLQP